MSELFEIQKVALELWKADQQVFNASERSAKELGAALAKVQAAMPYGEYGKWLGRNSISRNRASYCVRLANGKQGKAKKEREPRFVLDGLDKGTLTYLERFASDKGVTLAAYVVELLTAHVTERNARTPEQRLAKYEADRARELDKVKQLAVLADKTIHADTWQDRVRERCRILLYLVARDARPKLSDFVKLFDSAFGADKLPLKWVFGFTRDRWNVVEIAVYKREDVVPSDYTDAEENRRVKLLKKEHAQIKSENPNLYADKRHIDFRAGKAYRGFERATEGGEALYNEYLRPTPKLLTEGEAA